MDMLLCLSFARCSCIWSLIMSAIARLREGGYSFSCAVWNFLVVESMPTWKLLVMGVGLWQVLCLR